MTKGIQTAHHVVVLKSTQKNARDQKQPFTERKKDHMKKQGKGAPSPYRENRYEHTYEHKKRQNSSGVFHHVFI